MICSPRCIAPRRSRRSRPPSIGPTVSGEISVRVAAAWREMVAVGEHGRADLDTGNKNRRGASGDEALSGPKVVSKKSDSSVSCAAVDRGESPCGLGGRRRS